MSDNGQVYGDVIVDEEYITGIGAAFELFSADLNALFTQYMTVLEDMANEAVYSGDTHDALLTFITKGKAIADKIDDTGRVVKYALENYLDGIDEDDKYLY